MGKTRLQKERKKEKERQIMHEGDNAADFFSALAQQRYLLFSKHYTPKLNVSQSDTF